MSLIKNLDYKVGDFSMSAKQIELPSQGVTVLSGPSGAGKTTFLQILIGFIRCENFVWLSDEGLRLDQMSIAARRLAVVFQNDELFPHMTAEENVKIVLEARNTKTERTDALKQMQQLQQLLQLESCWKTRAQNLSGGEKQRVSLLRAVVSKPRLLLLDEPFSALDEKLKIESRSLIKKTMAQVSCPVLLVTHDQEDIEHLADHRISIQDGQLVPV